MADTPTRSSGEHRDEPPAAGVLPETVALAVIGCVDLLTTVYLVATGQAVEANPLMRDYLHRYGPNAFIVAKAILLGGPLAIAEWARARRPQFVRAALRAAIAIYLAAYVLAFIRYNLYGL